MNKRKRAINLLFIAMLFLGMVFISNGMVNLLAVILVFFLPILIYFFYWANLVWKDPRHADFTHIMKMNVLASTCTNLGLLTVMEDTALAVRISLASASHAHSVEPGLNVGRWCLALRGQPGGECWCGDDCYRLGNLCGNDAVLRFICIDGATKRKRALPVSNEHAVAHSERPFLYRAR